MYHGNAMPIAIKDKAVLHVVKDAGNNHGSAAKGSAIDLEVTGSGPIGCVFPFPPLSLPRVVLYLVFHGQVPGLISAF